MSFDEVLSTKYEIRNTQENLVFSNLEINHRVTLIVEGVGNKKWIAWYCKAYKQLGEETLMRLVSMAKTGKNPSTLFSYLLKQEMDKWQS